MEAKSGRRDEPAKTSLLSSAPPCALRKGFAYLKTYRFATTCISFAIYEGRQQHDMHQRDKRAGDQGHESRQQDGMHQRA